MYKKITRYNNRFGGRMVFVYRGKKIVVIISGAVFFIVLLFLLSLTVSSLGEEDAQRRVRLCMQREIALRHQEMLREQSVKLPDRETALQWQKEMQRVDTLHFESILVKRPVIDIILSPLSPTYVVRVVFKEEEQVGESRYFWLSWSGIDRETSRTIWLFCY